MPRIARIINHRGDPEPYDHGKVVASILDAVRSAGHFDETLADKLAPMVEFGLSRRYGPAPTVEDIAHCIEQSLRSIIDFPEIAEQYVANRKKRERLRELNSSEGAAVPNGAPQQQATAQKAPPVNPPNSPPRTGSSPASPHTLPSAPPATFAAPRRISREQVEAMLIREYGVGPDHAHEVAESVAHHADGLTAGLGLAAVPASLVRALADAELIARGLLDPALGPSQYTVAAFDVQQATFPLKDSGHDEASPAAAPSATPRELEAWAAAAVLRQHALARIHSRAVAQAHAEGSITLAGLGTPARFASIEAFVPRLLAAGAGLGLDREFPGIVAGAGEAVRRIAALTAALWDLSGGEVKLSGFDTALAPWAKNPAEADAMVAALLGRLALIVRNAGSSRSSADTTDARRLIVSLDAAAGQAHRPGSAALATAWLAAGGADGILTDLRVGAAATGDPLSAALIARAVNVAATGGPIRFSAVRSAAESIETTMFGETVARSATLRVTPAFVTVQLAANSLGGADGIRPARGNEADDELDRAIALAATGLRERRDFLARFHQRRLAAGNPTASTQAHAEHSSTDLRLADALSRAVGPCRVRLAGLAEAAVAQSGSGTSPAAVLRTAQRLAGYVALKITESGKRAGVDALPGGDDASFRLTSSDDELLAARLDREGSLHALSPDSILQVSDPEPDELLAAVDRMVRPDGPPVGCIEITPAAARKSPQPPVAAGDDLFGA
jgi:hypothetical protein